MANHVSNFVSIKNIDESIVKEVKRIFEYDDSNKSYQEATSLTLVNNIFGTDFTNDTIERSWMEENVGAKWVYGSIEEVWEGDEIKILLISAWDAVTPMITQLSNLLQKTKPDVVIESIFEDEAYEFAGASYFSKEYNDTEWMDIDEWDIDRFFDDDEYRDDFYSSLNSLMDTHRDLHNGIKTDK